MFAEKLIELCEYWNVPSPSLEWSNRMTSSAGIWYPPTTKYKFGVIRLNSKVRAQYGDESSMGTLIHEFVHHYLFFKYLNKGDKIAFAMSAHTEEFKRMCASLGGRMNEQLAGAKYSHAATNDYISKWTYACSCGKARKDTGRKLSARELGRWQCVHCKEPMRDWTIKPWSV